MKLTVRDIFKLKAEEVFSIFSDVFKIKLSFSGRFIETCAILNAKSGKCPSDCKFCAQSKESKANIKIYPLLSEKEMYDAAVSMLSKGVDRFSFVCSGIKPTKEEIKRIGNVAERIKADFPSAKLCASLGQLDREALIYLKESGIDRYHHNLETSKEFYPYVSSVQKWEDRYGTVARAKEIGFSVCSGGIFGLGESSEDILSLLSSLKELEVDSIPLNFLYPIKGTKFEYNNFLTPLKVLRIIFGIRVFFPDTVIRICGGREYNLGELQSFAVAVVDGLMVGNYLTTKGRVLKDDAMLIRDLGLVSGLKNLA
ncbi:MULTISPECIES: biotin synthase BioB [unclassified Desulfurobacterium]|uniref:biotin synthase BioB n=1 Tax=Desulfurobacterium sp. TC5-1 TaxID=1158318 RepID=UPI0003B75EE7|nr:biotin synthase BioB [Desulfurobacterium sp. TC5-1]